MKLKAYVVHVKVGESFLFLNEKRPCGTEDVNMHISKINFEMILFK